MEQAANFNITLDGAPYVVKAAPQRFNDVLQYSVSINEAEEVLFAFDSELGRYAPVGDNATNVPDNIEIEIGSRLNGLSLQKQ